jgi:hypothetical protein
MGAIQGVILMVLSAQHHNNEKVGSSLRNVLDLTKRGEFTLAEAKLDSFIKDKFDVEVQTSSLQIRKDNISLNSVNGTFLDGDGKKYFFKFHMEESETDTVEEYYQADFLAKKGFPVELPILASHNVGEQFLIYPYVEYERMFDVCLRIERAPSIEFDQIVAAQQALDQLTAQKCLETLTIGSGEDYTKEAVLQLFYWRLVDKKEDGTCSVGGRYARFYIDQSFAFPGNIELTWAELSQLKWNINGLSYDLTLEEAFAQAHQRLSPEAMLEYPACVSHGDAHNGNVWVKPLEDGNVQLSYFDPAFAGEKIPVLLGEIKPTFHNIFAHPEWLYSPQEAEQWLDCSVEIRNGTIYVTHNWALSPLRQAFLTLKQDYFWIPVLAELKKRALLPSSWQDYIRSALFCCPTLVMNLRAGAGTSQNSHTPKTSLLGLSIAIMLASSPVQGDDVVSSFFKSIDAKLQP